MSELLERAQVSPTAAAGIKATDDAFMAAVRRGDPQGIAQAYTRDATLMPPGAPAMQGREAIAGFWGVALEQLGVQAVDLQTQTMIPAGDYVQVLGRAVLTVAGGAQAEGKYAVLWREEDGQMRMQVDIWNMDA